MKIKHIYFFSSYNQNGISSRYRGIYVLDELYKKYGITSTFLFPSYKLKAVINFVLAYLKVLLFFQKGQVVIYQKLYTNGIYTNLLKLLVKLRPKDSIYDTDDADYLRYYDKNIFYFMTKCEKCVVGSNALKEVAKKYSNNVLMLSSPVIQHQEIKMTKNETLHIGWVGDYGLNNSYTAPYSHKVSLNEILFPILKELNFKFKFTILGIKSPVDKLEIESFFSSHNNILLDIPENINWVDELSIYKRISAFDIGVSPMVSHEFNDAKSAFKIKQYLSCGIPVLASPVGENLNFVKNGTNGFICKNSIEFKERIVQFNKMTNQEYDQFRENIVPNIGAFSMSMYCDHLVAEISK